MEYTNYVVEIKHDFGSWKVVQVLHSLQMASIYVENNFWHKKPAGDVRIRKRIETNIIYTYNKDGDLNES